MKVAAYNIRGLGSKGKKKDVREIILQFHIDICFILETKMETINDQTCKNIWGVSVPCDWAVLNSMGRFGGIICLWNSDKFVRSSNWNIPGSVVVNGVWKPENTLCCLIGVYGPTPPGEKIRLWEQLKDIATQNKDMCVIMVGDFNAIRSPNERVGRVPQVQF